MQTIHLLQLENYPILHQLQLEEALLRADTRNWCLINKGSTPAIVMGISGKPELLINSQKQLQNPLPLIKRFSGGGTVVVDEDTYFVTFICNSNDMNVPCYPEHVLRWSANVYKQIFPEKFQLKENDYAFADRKFGGNAQYFRKDRWLHHSSLLWDYKEDLMDYLLMPKKTPKYREGRTHLDFLCRLKDHVNLEPFDQKLLQTLSCRFTMEKVALEEVINILQQPHRKATTLINLQI